MKAYPIPGRVMILPDPKVTVTENGVVIPDSAQENAETGTVYSVYKQTWLEKIIDALTRKKEKNHFNLKEGVKVKFSIFSGKLIRLDENTEVRLMDQRDIDCIL